jgi:hypothetical protein
VGLAPVTCGVPLCADALPLCLQLAQSEASRAAAPVDLQKIASWTACASSASSGARAGTRTTGPARDGSRSASSVSSPQQRPATALTAGSLRSRPTAGQAARDAASARFRTTMGAALGDAFGGPRFSAHRACSTVRNGFKHPTVGRRASGRRLPGRRVRDMRRGGTQRQPTLRGRRARSARCAASRWCASFSQGVTLRRRRHQRICARGAGPLGRPACRCKPAVHPPLDRRSLTTERSRLSRAARPTRRIGHPGG